MSRHWCVFVLHIWAAPPGWHREGGELGHRAGVRTQTERACSRGGRADAGLLDRRELLTLGFHNKKVTHGMSTYPASSPVAVFEPKIKKGLGALCLKLLSLSPVRIKRDFYKKLLMVTGPLPHAGIPRTFWGEKQTNTGYYILSIYCVQCARHVIK